MLLRLLGVLLGQGPKPDVDALEALVIGLQVQAAVRAPGSPIEGRDAARDPRRARRRARGPERLVDLALRSGPYGDHFGATPDGLTLDRLAAAPHGIDLGPLEPRIPELLRTPSGKIELAPEMLIADLARARGLARPARAGPPAGRAPPRALEQLVDAQPADAREGPRALHAAAASRRRRARAASRTATRARDLVARRQRRRRRSRSPTRSRRASSACRTAGATTSPARSSRWPAQRPGANSNVLTDELALDPLSGTAVLNGIPVEVRGGLSGVDSCTRRAETTAVRPLRAADLADADRIMRLAFGTFLGLPSRRPSWATPTTCGPAGAPIRMRRSPPRSRRARRLELRHELGQRRLLRPADDPSRPVGSRRRASA